MFHLHQRLLTIAGLKDFSKRRLKKKFTNTRINLFFKQCSINKTSKHTSTKRKTILITTTPNNQISLCHTISKICIRKRLITF